MLNRSILMGRLTHDPELRQTQNGTAVVSFALAVERPKYKDKDTVTDFIDIIAWRNTAEFVSRWFQKGQLVAVEGRIQVRSYTDKDGNKRRAFEVVADQVYFAEKKKDTANTAPQEAPSYGYSSPDVSAGAFYDLGEMDDGELPF